MNTIRLKIEYDGTDFAGWQRQPNGLAVQEVVENALAGVLGDAVRLHSSGRTDAGVHARGMVAHFQTERDLPMQAYCEGANGLLPSSVAIVAAEKAPNDFHARFDARGKWYRYSICNRRIRSPLDVRFSWHVRSPLDVEAMRRAASSLVGEHDFAAFRASGCAAVSTRREIFSVDLSEMGDIVSIDVRGSGFLRNMIRIIAGTLVEVGTGYRDGSDIPALLARPQRQKAGRTAPACGLCLMEVWY
ncbi:MAG: tRNA pseudouridine(38-40) synthase TruA [Desulfuromonadales bacterium]|nr:tRNA pseudouridine(38-40) synthase TruA [Desulfuromonadales bacterium]NIR34027.1 tRNA pseudouridine(38-40) synthase TruA [Desulfuromonadales bacterium]NIS44078.1 tRNA pseudouridine(38-40) synthase TruA [Desulfuromonadales bacterium]